MADLFRILTGSAWKMSRERILRLDRRWVAEVLFCSRDRQGNPRFDDDIGMPLPMSHQRLEVARQRGWSEEQARRWAREAGDPTGPPEDDEL